jgi:hypothetical protein
MSQKIRTIHKPTILLEDLAPLQNSETGDFGNGNVTPLDTINYKIDFAKRTGLKTFFLNINGMMVDPKGIEKCRVDMTGQYPTITFRFKQDSEEFINLGLPKDGDIVSVFYRSLVDELKPLRMDFVITDVIAEGLDFFVIFGVINVQGLFKDSSFYHEGNSLETLIEVSKELELGFATNETTTNDKQSWVCATQPLDLFIKDVKSHIWKDEKSFFDCYVDNYYILNLVNVFEQLDNSKQKDLEISINMIRNFVQYRKDPRGTIEDEKLVYLYPLILDNYRETMERNHSITDLRILNNSSRISLEEGYQKVSHFYDVTLGQKVEIVSETIKSEGKETEFMTQKGKIDNKNWRKNTRHNWSGLTYSLPDHTTHPFFYQAKIQNEFNLREIDKFTIEVTLDDINFNIYRYMTIPIIWYEYGEVAKKKRIYEPEDRGGLDDPLLGETIPYTLNNFISGFYVVKGHSYEFIGDVEQLDNDVHLVQHKIILTRIEHPKNINVNGEGVVISNYSYDVT